MVENKEKSEYKFLKGLKTKFKNRADLYLDSCSLFARVFRIFSSKKFDKIY